VVTRRNCQLGIDWSMKTLVLVLAGCLAAGSLRAQLTEYDAQFLSVAMRTALAEEHLGSLIAQQAQTRELRMFGQLLVLDAQRPLAELSELARVEGVEVPTLPDPLQLAQLQSLATHFDEEFDWRALEYAVQSRQEQIVQVQEALRYLDKPALRNFARLRLNTLRAQIEAALKARPWLPAWPD